MTCARADHNAGPRVNIQQFIIQLHLRARLTFKEVVGFDKPLMVVQLAVECDLGNVNGAREIRYIGKRTSSGTAGTRNGGQIREVDMFVSFSYQEGAFSSRGAE